MLARRGTSVASCKFLQKVQKLSTAIIWARWLVPIVPGRLWGIAHSATPRARRRRINIAETDGNRPYKIATRFYERRLRRHKNQLKALLGKASRKSEYRHRRCDKNQLINRYSRPQGRLIFFAQQRKFREAPLGHARDKQDQAGRRRASIFLLVCFRREKKLNDKNKKFQRVGWAELVKPGIFSQRPKFTRLHHS